MLHRLLFCNYVFLYFYFTFSDVPCKMLLGQYFQPRYYRAPEILMGTEFDTRVDMWSFGIIITELFKGIVPFYGIDEVQMLGVLIQTFGTFPPEMIITTPKLDYYTSKTIFIQALTSLLHCIGLFILKPQQSRAIALFKILYH